MKTRTIRCEEYVPTVLKVTVLYPDGRPKDCIMIHDDQSTDVRDGAEFIVGFLPTKTVRKSTS